MKARFGALVLLALIGATHAQPFASVQDAVAGLPELSMLNKNTQSIALADKLRDPNFVGTLFAPSDSALKPLEEAVGGDLTSMLGDPSQVNDVFSTAVIPGQALTLADLKDGMKLTTLNGNTVDVKVTSTPAGNVYQINKAYIVKGNIQAGKSIIQEVSNIVIPPEYQDMLDALVPPTDAAAQPPVDASTTTTTTVPATNSTAVDTSSSTGSAPATTTTSSDNTGNVSTEKPASRVLATNSTQYSSAGSAAVGAALLAVPALLAMLF